MAEQNEEDALPWGQYYAAEKTYAIAVDELVKQHGRVDRDKHAKLTAAVQRAREEYERIHLVLSSSRGRGTSRY